MKQLQRMLGGGLTLIILLVAMVITFWPSSGGGGNNPQSPEPVVTSDGVFLPTRVAMTAEAQSPNTSPAEWYDIYFTNPQSSCPPEEERQGGLDEIVAEDMLKAELQVDVAAYDFDSEPMLEAMIALEERGVLVRMVTDEDYGDLSSIRRLRRNGISVVEDKRSALMHNKFVVIDGRYVWTGSMNFTSNGVYCNNNNLVWFDSPELAQNFTAEMNEMYDDREFGPRSPLNTPNEQFTIDGIQIENYFAAEDELGPIIGELVNQAQSEILFMAFSFTLDLIGDPVLARAEEGVQVRGVFETTGSDTIYSYYGEFADAGLSNLQVRKDGNGRIMHHKVIIIDRETVIFGSFNFSANANDSNDEAIVVVHDPTFASFFVEEFEVVWAEGKEE